MHHHRTWIRDDVNPRSLVSKKMRVPNSAFSREGATLRAHANKPCLASPRDSVDAVATDGEADRSSCHNTQHHHVDSQINFFAGRRGDCSDCALSDVVVLYCERQKQLQFRIIPSSISKKLASLQSWWLQ